MYSISDPGSAGFTITTTAPALSAPKSAPTYSAPSGNAITTRCSGSTPAAWSAWPKRLARVWTAE